MEFNERQVNELRECLELLQAIQNIEYHNKNWLPAWAIRNPGKLNQETRDLISRALKIIGSSSGQCFI
uniref:Uncharacterized protein n=1 Tax=viral metagenome TaxID=1070528 RepID=A0A6M3IXC2_9ZZZZ